MPSIDQLLRDQRDFAARLLDDPELGEIAILTEETGVTEADVLQALTTLNPRGGKIGAVAIVLTPVLVPETPDAPGPRSRARLTVQVIETPLYNRAEGGTELPASAIALRVRALLHLFSAGLGAVWTFAGQEPLPVDEGSVSVGVIFERPHQDTPGTRCAEPMIERDTRAAVVVSEAGNPGIAGTYFAHALSGDAVVEYRLADGSARLVLEDVGGGLRWVFRVVSGFLTYERYRSTVEAASPVGLTYEPAGVPPGPEPAPSVAEDDALRVVIEAESGAAIRYTLDGTYPGAANDAAALYAAPFEVESGARVRAVATLADKQASNVAEELFT